MRIVLVGLALAGCSKSDSKQPQSAATDNTGGQPSAASHAKGYEGSVRTSGLYTATWTVAPGNEGNPFNSFNNPSLASDKQTNGNIKVDKDGKVSFGSGNTKELTGQYEGSGAQVTLDTSGAFVCAFTVDTDLVSTRDASVKVHMSGSMTVHYDDGHFSCP